MPTTRGPSDLEGIGESHRRLGQLALALWRLLRKHRSYPTSLPELCRCTWTKCRRIPSREATSAIYRSPTPMSSTESANLRDDGGRRRATAVRTISSSVRPQPNRSHTSDHGALPRVPHVRIRTGGRPQGSSLKNLGSLGGKSGGTLLATDASVNLAWKAIAAGKDGPGARSRHCLAYDPGSKTLLLDGGIDWNRWR